MFQFAGQPSKLGLLFLSFSPINDFSFALRHFKQQLAHSGLPFALPKLKIHYITYSCALASRHRQKICAILAQLMIQQCLTPESSAEEAPFMREWKSERKACELS